MTSIKDEPTLDGASSNPVTPGLMQIRDTLNASGSYLGDPANTFRSHVVWKRVGRGYRLVTKESADAVDEADKNQTAAEPDSSQPTPSGSTIPSLEPAILSTILLIDSDNCWLTPCGFWKAPTMAAPRFEDVKLSFQGKAPSQTTLSEDFSAAVENAEWLIKEMALGGAVAQGFLVKTKGGNDALKFRHIVFEKLEDTSIESLESESDGTVSDSDDDWTMANWPVIHSEAAAQRDKLKSSHRPVPLPAYDINGALIAPNQCRNALSGAIARVSFTLNHWFIEKANHQPTNTFVADVNSIRVLVNPPSQFISPKKRKTARYDPEEESPTKKPHLM